VPQLKLQAPLSTGHLTQLESLQLAGLGAGQRTHELDLPWILVRRDRGLDMIL